MMGAPPPTVRVYRALLDVLPGSVGPGERDEMAHVLGDQLADAGGRLARLRVAARAFRRLPGAVWAEWLDEVRRGPAVGPVTRRRRRWEMGEWIRRVRLAVRSLGRSPAFALSSLLLVGVGVGSVTAVFTVVDHVLLRPLPYPDEARLVYMTNGAHPGPVVRGLSEISSVESFVALTGHDGNLERTDGGPLRLRGVEVSADFFAMFGARPALGRLLDASDAGSGSVVVLTHSGWTEIFGGDPDVVGRVMRVNRRPLQVVGVLAEDFHPPERAAGRTLHYILPMDWSDPLLDEPTYHRHTVMARLRPGLDLEDSNAELARLGERLEAQHPGMLSDRNGTIQRTPFIPLRDATVQDAAPGLRFLMLAVGLLLLVACANVAHLFLARGLERRREVSVRRALGAGTGTLVIQTGLESLLLGLGGGALGLVLAQAAITLFAPWIVDALPRGTSVTLDWRVLMVSGVLAASTALLFGLLPTLRTLATSPARELRGSGRGYTGSRSVNLLRNGLVAGEVALSLVLVAMSGLLFRSFLQMTTQEAGLRVADTWVVPVRLDTSAEPAEYVRIMEEMRRALLTVPGVSAATYGIEAPLQWVGGNRCCWSDALVDPGSGESVDDVTVHAMEASFLETYGIPLVAGRGWEPLSSAPDVFPVVLSEGVAVEAFGSAAAAVGRELALGNDDDATRLRVAGVAGDTRYYGLDQPIAPAVYIPAAALSFEFPIGTLAARADDEGPTTAGALREAIWSVQPNLPLPTVVPMGQWVDASSTTRRFGALILTLFGSIALLLAAGGLYGTLLYSVHQRRRELGIRLALGAGAHQVRSEILRRGVGLAVLGATVGVGLSLLAARLAESLLFGVDARDPLSLTLAVGVLLTTAAAASWFPARRASRTNPLETLSAE